MNVTTVVEKQVATMIRDNCQLYLKILREHFGTHPLSLVSILEVLLLDGYR